MKISKLSLAVATVLGASASASALAMDLYVDTKTKQIYAEPGPHRQLMGSFEKVQERPSLKAQDKSEQLDKAEIKAIREDLALKTNEIKALSEHAEAASGPDSVKVTMNDGLKFETKDGNFTTEIHGRVQTDAEQNINQQMRSYFTGNLPGGTNTSASAATGTPTPLNDAVGFRRARLSMEGTIYKDTDYKFEYDPTRGTGATAAGITDAFMRYNFSKPFSVKVGAFKEAASLEETTSDIQTTFIERNMAVNSFIDNLNVFKVGAGANYSADRWQAAAGLQTEGPGNLSNLPVGNSAVNSNGGVNRNGGGGDTSWELNGRLTGTPWMESKEKLLHVGGWGSYVNLNNNYLANGSFNNGGVAFVSGVGNNMDRTSILNTGNLTAGTKGLAGSHAANHYDRFGAETALVYGPFSAQAEYLQTNVHGEGYNNGESLNGYYGYMTYFLTGESRNYVVKTASFDRVKPKRNFDMKGGLGAWEVAVGYDYLNLNNAAIQGGRATVGKVGINWYPNKKVRLMTNWIHSFDINTTSVVNTTSSAFNSAHLDIIEERVQIDW